MAGSISPGMIEAVQRDIYDALARTSSHSTLPEEEQDKLLAQACAEACDILGGWVNSPFWKELAPARASAKKPIADATADWKRVRPFLDPLEETVDRISARLRGVPGVPEIKDASGYIAAVVESVDNTIRRYRRLDGQQLYDDATAKMQALKDQVCGLASELRTQVDDTKKKTERRSRARRILGTVAGVLLSVSLAMAGAGPSAVRQNIPEWGRDAVQVLVVHHIAETAAPTMRVAPPRVGPRLG